MKGLREAGGYDPRDPLIFAEKSGNRFVGRPDDTGIAQEGRKDGRTEGRKD
jgi:hypothetical protein